MARDVGALAPGRDYPRTWAEFIEWFHDEEVCLEFLERLRWPDGFVCPRCGAKRDPCRSSRGRRVCLACRFEATVIDGTIFHKTRTPLPSWFAAMWHITSQKQGANALGLQRVLGFGSYQTAWAMLHKMRRAMVRPDRDRLSGVVEVDESYVGGPERGVRGRQTEKKAIVAIAIELKEPKGFGRVRLQRISDVSSHSIIPFVCSAVEPGSIVHTDGWRGYNALPKHGYIRRKSVLSKSGDPAHVSMPGVHRTASLLKRWLLGTHQGGVANSQLDYYLDEYTFRFNRRTSRSRGLLFYRLLEQSVVTPPAPYTSLVAAHDGEGSHAG